MVKTFNYGKEFKLEQGGSLIGLEIAYTALGKLNAAKSNVVWVCHALTGDAKANVWWEGLIGKGKLFDPNDYFIVCANVIGSCYGSTGPLSLNPKTGKPYYHSFPLISARDVAHSFELLKEHLGIDKIFTVLGGSLGGQHALEFTYNLGDKAENLIAVATNALHSPWAIAFNEAQRMAIESDISWKEEHKNAGITGMAAARAMALISYRTYQTYNVTQEDDYDSKIGDYKAISYQRYQGEKLQKRFNAFTYWHLAKTMDSHNIGRGRGGIEKALGQIKTRTLSIGVSSDILFPVIEQKRIAEGVQNGEYFEVESEFGHDGFLIETTQITKGIKNFFGWK